MRGIGTCARVYHLDLPVCIRPAPVIVYFRHSATFHVVACECKSGCPKHTEFGGIVNRATDMNYQVRVSTR
jgi:hypothetical protein